MRSIETTLYTGIDYKFRPGSYWTASANPLEAMLRNMKGQRRRETVRDLYAAGKLEGLSDILLSDSLDDEARNRLGQIRPTFMGGEYLPDHRRRETEIACIELASTTSDAISLRARPVGSRIEYSLVDEYASEFTLPQRTWRQPFSLRQLIRFLESIPRRFHFIPDMRPRFFPTAQAELDHINVALRRAYPSTQRTKRSRKPFRLPSVSLGPVIYVLGLVLLGAILLHPWQKSVDPLGDAKLSNAPPQHDLATAAANDPAMIAEFNRNKEWYRQHPVVSSPTLVMRRADLIRLDPNVPRAALVSLGTPSVQTNPLQGGDAFWVQMPDGRWVVATAVGRANSQEELPWTGNQIGDAIWIGQQCFVWLNPIGQTNHPLWIDP